MRRQSPLTLFFKGHLRESILLLLIGGALLYFYHHDSATSKLAPIVLERQQQLYMENVTVHQYSQNQLLWTLKAEDATVFENTELLHLRQVQISSLTSPQESGTSKEVVSLSNGPDAIETQLSASQADIDWKQEKVEFIGNIKLSRSNGLEIRANQASYYYPVGTVLVPDEVTVTQGDYQMFGNDLIYQLKEAHFHLKRVVMAY